MDDGGSLIIYIIYPMDDGGSLIIYHLSFII